MQKLKHFWQQQGNAFKDAFKTSRICSAVQRATTLTHHKCLKCFTSVQYTLTSSSRSCGERYQYDDEYCRYVKMHEVFCSGTSPVSGSLGLSALQPATNRAGAGDGLPYLYNGRQPQATIGEYTQYKLRLYMGPRKNDVTVSHLKIYLQCPVPIFSFLYKCTAKMSMSCATLSRKNECVTF